MLPVQPTTKHLGFDPCRVLNLATSYTVIPTTSLLWCLGPFRQERVVQLHFHLKYAPNTTTPQSFLVHTPTVHPPTGCSATATRAHDRPGSKRPPVTCCESEHRSAKVGWGGLPAVGWSDSTVLPVQPITKHLGFDPCRVLNLATSYTVIPTTSLLDLVLGAFPSRKSGVTALSCTPMRQERHNFPAQYSAHTRWASSEMAFIVPHHHELDQFPSGFPSNGFLSVINFLTFSQEYF